MKLRILTPLLLLLAFHPFGTGVARADDVIVHIENDSAQPLRDVLVYLEAPGMTPAPIPEQPYLLDQRDLTFVPRVLPIPVGARVRFVNHDDEVHNVNSHSSAQAFNFGLPRNGSEHTLEFPDAGVVPLLCDVHPHMRAFIVVLRTPWFAVTDDSGRVVLPAIAPGEYTLVVWREGKVAARDSLVVSTARVERTVALDVPAAAPQAPRNAPAGLPEGGWAGVVARVQQRLAQARAHADAGRESEAATACYDAYFVHFEAEGMETAVRENISARKAFEDEEQFGAVREALVALARGNQDGARVQSAQQELLDALAADARELGDTPVSTPSAPTASGDPRTPEVEQPAAIFDETPPALDAIARTTAEDVVLRLREGFAVVTQRLQAGDRAAAAAAIGDVYFVQFHRIEAALKARFPSETVAAERRFQVIRGRISAGDDPAAIAADLAGLADDVAALAEDLKPTPDRPWLIFVSALLIIVREGFEALIVISAILAFTARSGRTDMARAVYFGTGAAIVASVLTAWGFRTLLQATPARQEAIEGVTMLLAAAVLFYVSYWFIANAQLARWNRFVQDQVRGSLVRGSLWSLGLVAFLAVFREGAETVLFYEALAAGSGGWTFSLLAGLGVGCVALGLIYVVFRAAAVRLPLKALFTVTSFLLYAMGFVLAGKGVAELQEAGWLGVTSLSLVPNLAFLGIFPSLETTAAQAVFVVAGLFGLVALRRSAQAAAADPVPSSTAETTSSVP